MTVATRSTEECSASEISARLPIATPTTNLVAAMPALAKIEIAATRVLTVTMGALMGRGLAGRAATSTRGFATANQSRQPLLQFHSVMAGLDRDRPSIEAISLFCS